MARPAALVIALWLAACASPVPEPLTTAPIEPLKVLDAEPKPPFVVALVVDQLAAWELELREGELDEAGGFARLFGEGARGELSFSHANNQTAPGHAALFTGAPAGRSGIAQNGKLTPKGRYVSFLTDPETRLIGWDGPLEREGVSLAALRLDTVADRLRAEVPEAQIISLSIKDRGAVFGGGRTPTASLWFDPEVDGFVTSSAFGAALPAFAQALAPAGATRTLRTPAWVPEVVAPDRERELGQGDYFGLGRHFPHEVEAAESPATAFRATPYADRVLVDLAIAAVDAMAFEPGARLLSVSLSAHDYVGHVFGPHAPEQRDLLRRLDRQLGRLFSHLDTRLGEDGWSAVLSADHGVVPTPEAMTALGLRAHCEAGAADRWELGCDEAVRADRRGLVQTLEAAAARAVQGSGPFIRGIVEPYVLWTEEARALAEADRERLREALTGALTALPYVHQVFDATRAPTSCPDERDESVEALVCRSIVPGDDRMLYVVLRPGSHFDTGYVWGHGTNHGSPWLHDRVVPLLLRAPGRVEGGRRFSRVDQRAYARTLSSLLLVAPPTAAEGGVDLTKTLPEQMQ